MTYDLSADMDGMGFIENNKAACMLSVLTNTHTLIVAKKDDTERYFFSSSACVYSGNMEGATDETTLKEEGADPADAGFGWERLIREGMCRHFWEDHGFTTRVVRSHNMYGPNRTFDGGRAKARAAICVKVIEAKLGWVPSITLEAGWRGPVHGPTVR